MLKCSMLFNSATNRSGDNSRTRTGGFSESFYLNMAYGQDARDAMQRLCLKRALLLPTGTNIVGQQYSTVDPVGPSATQSRLFPGTAGYAADVPQMSAQCRGFSNDARNVSKLTIKAIPDAWVVEGELFLLPLNKGTFTNFFNQLRDDGWCFRGRNLSYATYPLMQITALGAMTLETVPGGLGDFVRVLRTETASGVRTGGRYRILSVEPDGRTFNLANWDLGATTGGSVRRDGIVYPPYAGAELVQAVTRKVGRPFGGYRGRASKRR